VRRLWGPKASGNTQGGQAGQGLQAPVVNKACPLWGQRVLGYLQVGQALRAIEGCRAYRESEGCRAYRESEAYKESMEHRGLEDLTDLMGPRGHKVTQGLSAPTPQSQAQLDGQDLKGLPRL